MPGRPMQEPRVSWPRRVGWLVLIWTASVAALGVAAAAMHGLMSLARLTG